MRRWCIYASIFELWMFATVFSKFLFNIKYLNLELHEWFLTEYYFSKHGVFTNIHHMGLLEPYKLTELSRSSGTAHRRRFLITICNVRLHWVKANPSIDLCHLQGGNEFYKNRGLLQLDEIITDSRKITAWLKSSFLSWSNFNLSSMLGCHLSSSRWGYMWPGASWRDKQGICLC